jgi:ATP-dependent DNA helicase DinG
LNDLPTILGVNGPFAQRVAGYRFRAGQVALAEQVQKAIETRQVVVAEAGTGTGKTWAYLVPAILSGSKVLVSTGTRTLQDQLFSKDLPLVREILQVPLVSAILKGRGNYVCHLHLERLQQDPDGLKNRSEVVWLRQIRQFAASSSSGDRAELASIPEDADLWNRVTSTRENCLGQECPHVRDCFVYKARRQAQDADLVVINHALFMADAALKEEGVSDLLPESDVVVFDEAHQLPAVATRFLGQTLSTGQVQDLARQAEAVGLAQAREAVKWTELAGRLTQSIKDWRLSCDWVDATSNRRATPAELRALPQAVLSLSVLQDALRDMAQALLKHEERHPDLAALARTALSYEERLAHWSEQIKAPALPGSKASQQVFWMEVTTQHVRFNAAPLSITEAFSRERQGLQAWVFVSATLSVRGEFGHFIDRLGLHNPITHSESSPFDYASQACLCVPKVLPEVNHPDYAVAFATWLFPVIQASQGAALVLCTTLRAVEKMGEAFRDLYEEHGLDWPILQQGRQPRRALLEQFRELDRPVLIGSASFWEGIDVVGEKLTVVAIDKLPFAPPDDPILEARLDACRQRGGNPFTEFQIPEAAIALKQGAGRLIRSEQDWGVLLVGDRRLVDKPYGKLLWQGLPAFKRTRERDDAIAFITDRRKEPV